jgi:hypothetical protein
VNLSRELAPSPGEAPIADAETRGIIMNLNLRLLAASAALALSLQTGTGAIAAEPGYFLPMNDYSATLTMYAGAASPDDDLDPDGNPLFLGGAGSVVMNMMGFGVQLDVFSEGGIIDNGTYGYGTAGFGGHLYWRDPTRGLFGVLANVAAYGDGYNEYGYFRHALGVEGQLYMSNITIYGQLALLGKTVDDCECATTSVFAKAEGRFFLNQNAMAALRGEWNAGDIWDSDTFSRATIGLRGEVMLGMGPASLFADAAFSTHTYNGSHSFNDVTVKGGVTFHVGKQTLFDEDRSGTTLTQPFVGVDELMHFYY